ncbi:MAG: WecB/TagA/CpsF family glycosyltransferase [Candidatus Omnitrophota bacterium]
MANFKKSIICGIPIDNLSFCEVIKAIENLLTGEKYSFVVTPNIDHIVKIQTDTEFKEIYDKADLILADGMPLIWASKFLGCSLKEKVSGSDLFPALCDAADKKGYKVFFLGGRADSAVKAAEILKQRYQGLQVVGIYSPLYGFEKNEFENNKIIQMIKQAQPDILFVGLGAPKQEKWIFNNKEKYQVPVSIGIGASFDFVAGVVKRAPIWMQKVGLEWFWRLMMDPIRLWKRYLVDDIKFFWLLFYQRFIQNKCVTENETKN